MKYNLNVKIHKGMTNVEIAELLSAVAAAYQLKSGQRNKFKIVAYERASDAVEHMSSEAKDLHDDGKLEEVAGIGKSIASHLGEIFETGESKHFEDIMEGLPPAMFDLMKVNGVGTKTAYKLTTEFKITPKNPLKQLERIAKEGKIENLEGFGKDSQDAILKSIKEVSGKEKRLLVPYAEEIAREVLDWVKKSKFVERADTLGSLRRKTSTVGDVDIAASTNNPHEVLEHFSKYPKASRVLEKGERTSSIIVPGGKQVDLMVETPDAYGALLQHFTGSKHHNIALRKLALKKNLSLSDYGIYEITRGGTKKLMKTKTEKEFYNKLGMKWIPPELREDRGEIEAATMGKLPTLVELGNIKGDLHVHSDFDIETSHDLGQSSMESMVHVGDSLGYEYVAFTEHNPSKSKHTSSQIIEILKKKREKVDMLNEKLAKKEKGVKKVFNSLEIDMLTEGGTSVPDEVLEQLDFALVSIHSSFHLSREKMTKRVLASLEHPKVKIFAHPTGRKLNEREGVELNWDEIFGFSLKNDKWVEINSSASRLDLPDVLVHDAVKLGVKLAISTDAHHTDHMNGIPYGISVARRGWAEKNDIVNTRSLREFESMLE